MLQISYDANRVLLRCNMVESWDSSLGSNNLVSDLANPILIFKIAEASIRLYVGISIFVQFQKSISLLFSKIGKSNRNAYSKMLVCNFSLSFMSRNKLIPV